MDVYLRFILKRRFVVLVLFVITTTAAIYATGKLNIVIDDQKILPQRSPYVIASNTIERVFGVKYALVVMVHPHNGDIINQDILARIAGLTRAIDAVPGVIPGKTLSIAAARAKMVTGNGESLVVERIMGSVPRTEQQLEAVRDRIRRMPLYDGILVSPDLRSAAVISEFRPDPTGFKNLLSRIETAVAPYRAASVDITLDGLPVFLAAVESYAERLGFLVPIGILIIGLLHFEAFRTVQGFVLPLVTALLSVIWSLGLMGAAGVRLDPFNSVAPFAILAIAAGHAVQILKRYYEDYDRLRASGLEGAPANREAVISALAATGPVMICAGFVAAASMFSLAIFDVESVRAFGIFTGTGILCALGIELTFIPAVRSLLRPPKRNHRPQQAWRGVMGFFSRAALSSQPISIALIGGAAVLLAIGASRVVVDNSVKKYFTGDQQIVLDDAKVNQAFGGSNTFYVSLTGDAADAIKRPEVIAFMAKIESELLKIDGVGKAISIADFIQILNQGLKPGSSDLPKTQDEIAQLLLLYSLSGEPNDFDSMVDTDYRSALIQVFVKKENSAFFHILETRVRQIAASDLPNGVSLAISGTIANPAALTDVLVGGKAKNIAVIALMLFVFASLLFRSPLAGVLIVIPLGATILIVYGLMGWTGTPLQLSTATVSAMAVGIGADYAIYFAYRLREELRAAHPLDIAVARTFDSAGQAVIYVATAVMGGYAVLILSYGFMIHFWLGSIMVLTMVSSALAALTLFPILLIRLRPRFIFEPTKVLRPHG